MSDNLYFEFWTGIRKMFEEVEKNSSHILTPEVVKNVVKEEKEKNKIVHSKKAMPTLPFFAELSIERDDGFGNGIDDTIVISFNYVGVPDHPRELKKKLRKISERLLKTQIPPVYTFLEKVQSYEDPDMTDVVVQRKNLKDSQITWLMYHLKRGFESRAISKEDKIHASIEEGNVVRWLKLPKSGFRKTAERAIQTKKMSSPKRNRRKISRST